ncbi:MAG TPA: DUF6186 family protein [Actinomycetota bacterium]
MRTVAIVGWVVIFAALFAWQGIGLARDDGWPTMSDMIRAFTRPVPGRVVLFGMWLWLGWHVFIRGWEFFLRGRT